MGMPPLGVGQREPAHEPREVAVRPGPDHKMEVIPHHAEGEQPHLVARDRLGQDPLEGFEIAILGEDGQPCVGAIQTVVNESAFGGAQRSSHHAEFNEKWDEMSRYGS